MRTCDCLIAQERRCRWQAAWFQVSHASGAPGGVISHVATSSPARVRTPFSSTCMLHTRAGAPTHRVQPSWPLGTVNLEHSCAVSTRTTSCKSAQPPGDPCRPAPGTYHSGTESVGSDGKLRLLPSGSDSVMGRLCLICKHWMLTTQQSSRCCTARVGYLLSTRP